MNFRLLSSFLCFFLFSCTRSDHALTDCELALDSLENMLTERPDYAATQHADFMRFRRNITEKLNALEHNTSLSEADCEQRDLLILRSSLLFTEALEAALKSTRAQADSLNQLKLKQEAK
ncbi:MAG: hypothetical protein RLZZ370_815 [Bacteroidota bacterium]|jgi:hypothetical protein